MTTRYVILLENMMDSVKCLTAPNVELTRYQAAPLTFTLVYYGRKFFIVQFSKLMCFDQVMLIGDIINFGIYAYRQYCGKLKYD